MKESDIYYVELDEVKSIRMINAKKLKKKGRLTPLEFNPFKQTVGWIKLTMVVMYITLVLFLGIFIWYLVNYNSLTLVWSKYLYVLWLSIILLGLSGSISVLYMFSKGNEDRIDRGWFDAWSFAHFIRDMTLVLIPYYFGINIWLCFLISVGFATVYELFERFVVERFWYNLGAEDFINHLSDIVIAVMGCFVAYIIIIYVQ